MEFGARALGNRSIVCDPSRPDAVRIINEKIKGRDFWMPFAPSILAERRDDYIEGMAEAEARYMTLAFDSRPLAREHLRAAVHPYDFTVRPQIVDREVNPEWHDLIRAFERRTGIGAILNTSFNLHGEPIVCTAADAVSTLCRSGLDGVILPGLLALRRRRTG
jgi:carbamoyltransferase